MKTKTLCLILVIFAGVSVLHAQRVKVGDLYYSLNAKNQTATVVSEGDYNSNYAGLKSANILPSVTYNNIKYRVNKIGKSAFISCHLDSIIIPSSIDTIVDYAFHYGDVSNVFISDLAAWCRIQFGVEPQGAYRATNPLFDGAHLYLNNKEVIDLVIPNGVSEIKEGAFIGGLFRSVTIPSSVTAIGTYTFIECDSLEAVYISDIAAWCNMDFGWNQCLGANPLCQAKRLFLNNIELTDLVIPNNVSTISHFAFDGCTSIRTIYVPNSVTSIGESAFACPNLSSITMESSTPIKLCDYGYCTNPGLWCANSIYVPCGSLDNYQQAEGWSNYSSSITHAPYPSYTITKQATNGSISTTSTEFTICDTPLVTCTAKPDMGYYFVRWGDGKIENPRTIELTQDTIMTAYFAMNYSGQCGDNLYWKYDNEILTITGTGDMYDTEIAPWKLFRDSIASVVLPNGLTSIGYGGAFEECKNLVKVDIPSSVTKINSYAFYDCEKLNSVTLPISLTTLGYSAFEGCRKLYNIYCYAAEPPVAEASSFENYNVYLRVPCDNLQDYQMDAVFGSFKYIECIGAEETPTTSVIIVPNTNSVEITWPKNDQAANYTIEIKKDDVTFCTLTFNAQGQLTSIAFAPGRGANKNVNAIEVANGYKFTITCLNPGTKYNYEIDTKNAAGTSLANYTGEFTTKNPTALDQLTDSPSDRFTKVIKEGQLFILRDGKTYNAQGALVE